MTESPSLPLKPREDLAMYEISGHGPISERDQDRYKKDKEQDRLIAETTSIFEISKLPVTEIFSAVKAALRHENIDMRVIAARAITAVPKEEQPELQHIASGIVRECLLRGSTSECLKCVKIIEYTPREDRVSLIELAFNHKDLNVKLLAIFCINYVHDNESADLKRMASKIIIESMESDDPAIQVKAASMIILAPEEDQSFLVEKAINHSNPDVQMEGIARIYTLKEEDRARFVLKAINDDNPEIQKEGIARIRNLKEEERFGFIKKILDEGNIDHQIEAMNVITYIPAEKRDELKEIALSIAKKRFAEGDDEMKLKSLSLSLWTPQDMGQVSLVEQALDCDNQDIQFIAAGKIRYVEEDSKPRLQSKVVMIVRDALQHGNIDSQLKAAEMIQYVSYEDRLVLEKLVAQAMKKDLENGTQDVQVKSIQLFNYTRRDCGPELIPIIKEKKLLKLLIEPPLYKRNPEVRDDRFSRGKFVKDGSDTTLVGGPLKGKLIIRHIQADAFVAWQKLYEDCDLWRANGFDYVPIEPIQSYQLKGGGLVDVYSGVLDLNLSEYINVFGNSQELQEQKKKIKGVLESINFVHGHMDHDRNFCLRFYRDEDGEPDITRLPRIYLIDFDMAYWRGE